MIGSRAGTSRARLSTSRHTASRAERVWQVLAVLSVAALSWWYFTAPGRDHTQVMTLGWIGTVLAVLAAAFTVRKRVAYQGMGKLSVWLTAHIYLGLVAAFAILYHSGSRAGGTLTAGLLV